MPSMVLDEATRQQLSTVNKSTLLYDTAGNVIGMFTPANTLNAPPYLSDEEIERRANSEKRYTTEEVLKHLKGLK